MHLVHLLTLLLNVVAVDFIQIFDDIPKDSRLFSVIGAANGDIYVTGYVIPLVNYKAYVARFDSNGALIWSKYFGTTDHEFGSQIIQTSDNNVVVAGERVAGSTKIFLAKFSSEDGSVLWSRLVDVADGNFHHLSEAQNGDLLVCGELYISLLDSDAVLVRISSAGDLVWGKPYTVNHPDGYTVDHFISVHETTTGDLKVFGWNGWNTAQRTVAATLTSTGTVISAHVFDDSASNDQDELSSVAMTPDGGYVLFGGSTNQGSGTQMDWFLCKVSGTGLLEWSKLLKTDYRDQAREVIVTDDGELLVAGSLEGQDNLDKVLAKYAPNGDLLWVRGLDELPQDFDELYSVDVAFDGSILVVGREERIVSAVTVDQFWMAKLDANGTIEGCNLIDLDYREVYTEGTINYTMEGITVVESDTRNVTLQEWSVTVTDYDMERTQSCRFPQTLVPTLLPTPPPTPSSTSPPTMSPTHLPSSQPSSIPTSIPTDAPSVPPSTSPSMQPSMHPSTPPSMSQTMQPSISPSLPLTNPPIIPPTTLPSTQPTMQPSVSPSIPPSTIPTLPVTSSPSSAPTSAPSILVRDCGNCINEHATASCGDPITMHCVCAAGPFEHCCTEQWDETCKTRAIENCYCSTDGDTFHFSWSLDTDELYSEDENDGGEGEGGTGIPNEEGLSIYVGDTIVFTSINGESDGWRVGDQERWSNCDFCNCDCSYPLLDGTFTASEEDIGTALFASANSLNGSECSTYELCKYGFKMQVEVLTRPEPEPRMEPYKEPQTHDLYWDPVAISQSTDTVVIYVGDTVRFIDIYDSEYEVWIVQPSDADSSVASCDFCVWGSGEPLEDLEFEIQKDQAGSISFASNISHSGATCEERGLCDDVLAISFAVLIPPGWNSGEEGEESAEEDTENICEYENNIEVTIIVLTSAVVFLIVMVVLIKCHFRHARAADFSTFFFSLFDLVTDCLFIRELYNSSEEVEMFLTLAVVATIFLTISYITNLTILLVFMRKVLDGGTTEDVERRRERKQVLHNWFYRHHFKVIVVLVLASSHIDSVVILGSEIFKLEFLSAPWSRGDENYAIRFGVVGNLLEDVPQIIIQIIVISLSSRECLQLGVFTEISLASSLVALLTGFVKRLIFYIVSKSDENPDLPPDHQARAIQMSPRTTMDDTLSRHASVPHYEDVLT